MACQGRCRVAVRSTLYKACEVKYSTYREEGTVGVRCTRTESTVFTGFSVGIHELLNGGHVKWKSKEQNINRAQRTTIRHASPAIRCSTSAETATEKRSSAPTAGQNIEADELPVQ